MRYETDRFTFSKIQACFLESQELIDGQRKAPIVSGIASAEVECKSCQNSWTVKRINDSSFRLRVGGALVTCPSCSASELVNDGQVAVSASRRNGA